MPTRLFLFLAAILFIYPEAALAQITPQQVMRELGRGINLGNTLEPPTESAWNNGPAQEYYFDEYVDAGFTTVRVPVRWDQHTQNTPPYAVNESWMQRVEEVIDWGLERDLYVIVNAHHDDWIKDGYSDPNLRARFDSIWVQIAERFEDRSEKLLFEIINEPFGMTVAEVDDLNERVLGIIRETNPTRIVIYSGNVYSGPDQLISAAIPDDDYLMGYYHSYDPWPFAGLAEVPSWGTTTDRAAIAATFDRMAAWSAENDVPIMISEFGAIHDNDYNSRMRHYGTYVSEAVRTGIPFQVWDDGGMFEVLYRNQRAWDDTKDILIYAHPDGPQEFEASSNGAGVDLAWTTTATVSETLVQRRRDGGTFETVATLPPNAFAYTDTDFPASDVYDYRVIAMTAEGTPMHSYPQRVDVRFRLPFLGEPHIIPGIIEAEDFDLGGQGLGYNDTDERNRGRDYRRTEGVDIDAFDGGFLVTDIVGGEWMDYTVNVTEAGPYTITAYVGAESSGGRFRLSFDGVETSTLRAPETGSDTTIVPVSTTLDLVAGQQSMRVDIRLARPFTLDRFTIQPSTNTATEDAPGLDIDLALYPNPARQTVTLEHTLRTPEAQVEVFNLLGQRIHQEKLQAGTHRLAVNGWAPGLYLLRLTDGDRLLAQQTLTTF
ncbi:MAG: cellulase family glycosylhydrolase [Bacteroidota bacterium]